MDAQYEINFQKDNNECICGSNSEEVNNACEIKIIDTSSSENEEDYFHKILPIIKEDELREMTKPIEPQLRMIKPALPFLDNTTMDTFIALSNPGKFFINQK